MAKVAVVVTDLFEDSEYTEPVNALKEAGHEVVNIENKAGNVVEGKSEKAKVTIDKGIDDVSASDFDALLIPGGFSPDILRADDRFVSFSKKFMDDDKPVMAICHGPQLLITAEALNGRDVTGYKSIHVDLKNAGAKLHDEEVIVCGGQLVTSRTPDDIPAFIKESLNVLAK
ncbi:type 1 glutamine amidotransferase domain-containing protein [Alkalihalobacillus trypoxylicola]|uniref:Cysteine protease n=1 Tax=Alkalihalobacillus trypoxylicola TaxID=519424 RepID=A0A161PHH1_9BACI|nr:type 1 glutamine amidotransferase domain-containing protein [Alkalihalobacillus trypoxylicola]KYG32314.1 cysteine protease [Alkalihalobacillus trypoxylicola]